MVYNHNVAPVAQLVEQYPFKVMVQGSNPCGGIGAAYVDSS